MNVNRTIHAWDRWAQVQGYDCINTYMHAHYIRDQMSLERVGLRMGIKRDRVAQLLRRFGIPVRGRGGVR